MARPQNVLHLLNSAAGGAALSTLAIIDGLRSLGVSSCAVCHTMGTPAERDQLRDAVDGRVIFTRLYWWNHKTIVPRWRRPFSEVKQILATRWMYGSTAHVVESVARWQADLIHTNTILTPEGGLAARRLGLPHVWHLRELLGEGKPYRLPYEHDAFGRYMQSHCSMLVANSHTSAAQIRSWVPEDLLAVVPNGINISRFQPRTHANGAKRLVVAMVGNLTSRWKKHALFVEAATRVDRSLPIEWRIYGHDPSRGGAQSGDAYVDKLHARIAEARLEDRFTWPGFMAEPSEIMKQIDILVHPADGESFGRVVVEAMAAGLPIVGVRAGGVAEIIEDGRTGLIADTDDPDGLARRIEQLARNPELIGQLGKAGRERALTHYSQEACTARILEIYEQAMQRPLRLGSSGGRQTAALQGASRR